MSQKQETTMLYIVRGTYPSFETPMVAKLARRYDDAVKLLRQNAPHVAQKYRLIDAEPASISTYGVAHHPDYVQYLVEIDAKSDGQSDFLSEAVRFEKVGVGGTLRAADLATQSRSFAFHIGGGYHHGFGNAHNSIDYCNDVAIAIRTLQAKGYRRIALLDLDTHFPDGVQDILGHDPSVLRLSLHQWDSMGTIGYWTDIGVGDMIGRQLNIAVPRHSGDEVYLNILTSAISAIDDFSPDVVVYQAGVDAYHDDPVGSLNLSLQGLYDRDVAVAALYGRLKVPFMAVLGGGYHPTAAPKAIVNTLAAFATETIVFSEPRQSGINSAPKAYRWYEGLRSLLGSKCTLRPIQSEDVR